MLLILISVFFAYDAEATWYGQIQNNKLSECIFWNENLDDSWKSLNKQFGSCEVRTGSGTMISGFILRCGENNNQFFFRSKRDCELMKIKINDGAQVEPQAYAPNGIKDPTSWVVAIDGCFTKAATSENLSKVGLQKIDDYCLCIASKTSVHNEREFGKENPKTSQLIVDIATDCAKQIGTTISSEIQNNIRENVKRKIQKIKPPIPGKNAIHLSPDTYVYEHWFFVASKAEFDKMAYIRSSSSVVKMGQRFGFHALFRSKKDKLRLKVELHVPSSPENFPSHSGKVTISADQKTVTVEDEIDGFKGSTAFYWGVGKGDPKGKYELRFSLEGVPIETYKFTVE